MIKNTVIRSDWLSKFIDSILYGFEKPYGFLCVRIVINTGRVKVQHLAVHHFFASADVADTAQQFLPIISADRVFETLAGQVKLFCYEVQRSGLC